MLSLNVFGNLYVVFIKRSLLAPASAGARAFPSQIM